MSAAYRAVDLIAAKRDGAALDGDAVGWLVARYLAGAAGDGPVEVSEAQMAALLMAGVCRGFTADEASALTRALVASGETLDVSGLPAPVVDKHSTGGVGDATTLLVAPLVAAAGATMVKLAGRGLGHTGGTIDKLEAIPGLCAELAPDAALAVAAEVGCVVTAQSSRLVPGDGALYALRDETATVAEPALIASSVMSKKLAASAPTIVLDVKTGDGAFMVDEADARALAQRCVAIGADAGRVTRALVTDMDQPLGRRIGHALEVAECAELLTAPADPEGTRSRLAALALELASQLVASARAGQPAAEADVNSVRVELARRWDAGEAADRLRAMVAAQGGDPAVVDSPAAVLPTAPVRRELAAPRDGVVHRVAARAVGDCVARLGAGRVRKGAAVDPAVGVDCQVVVGQRVERGQPLARVHARDDAAADAACARLADAVVVAEGGAAPPPLVRAVVG